MEEVLQTRLDRSRGRVESAWIWSRGFLDIAVTAFLMRLGRRRAGARRLPIGSLALDMRYAVRSLSRARLFSLTAIGTLALGIGATVAVFSIVYQSLLKPLPYPESDRLVVVWPERNFNNAMVRGVKASVPALQGVSGIGRWRVVLTGEGSPRELEADRVTPGFLSTLGVRPHIGRLFTEEDALPDAEDVAILSYPLWVDAFGADPAILGRRVLLDGADATGRTVVGVLPRAFRSLTDDPDLWIPFTDDPSTGIGDDRTWYVNDRIARLAPGATLEQADAQLRAFAQRAHEQAPTLIEEEDVRLASVVPLQPHLTRSVRSVLWVTLGVAGLVLLIACANVANLLLARGQRRRHDLSVRVALGAGRRGVIRLLLAESALIGGIGGLLGVLVAFGLLRAVLALAPPDLPRLYEVGVDPTMLGFAVGLTVVATALAGLWPAIHTGRLDGTSGLGGSSRSRVSEGRSSLSRGLVAAEMALAVVVAVGSGLMLRSLGLMLSEDPGLDGTRVVVFSAAPPEGRYPDQPSFYAYYEEALEQLRALPGVASVGAINLLPGTTENWSFPMYAEGLDYSDGEAPPSVNFRVVMPGYFETVGMSLERGRFLDSTDRGDSEPVALVNRAFVDAFWEGSDPLGLQVRWFSSEAVGHRVAGVVGDVRQHGISREARPEVYVPYGQLDWIVPFWVAARIDGSAPPTDVAAMLREGWWSVDPDVPITRIATLDAVFGASAATTRFLTLVITAFGFLALTLCASGVFGVTAFATGKRTAEFGVRVALGSTRAGVLEVALRSMVWPILLGVTVGALLAFGFSGALASSLYEVSPDDPLTFALATSALVLVGLAAALLPAWKASRVDPVRALASE